MRHRRATPAFERQTRLRAVKCLNLRRLVAAKHQRLRGRIKLQADGVFELLDEAQVIGEFDQLDPMQFDAT